MSCGSAGGRGSTGAGGGAGGAAAERAAPREGPPPAALFGASLGTTVSPSEEGRGVGWDPNCRFRRSCALGVTLLLAEDGSPMGIDDRTAIVASSSSAPANRCRSSRISRSNSSAEAKRSSRFFSSALRIDRAQLRRDPSLGVGLGKGQRRHRTGAPGAALPASRRRTAAPPSAARRARWPGCRGRSGRRASRPRRASRTARARRTSACRGRPRWRSSRRGRSSALAIPRSISLTRGRPSSSRVSIRLSGATSRWITPRRCRYAEGEQGLVRDLESQRQTRAAARPQQVGQVDAVDVLHDEVGRAVVVEREVVVRADVGMLQAHRGLGFFEEAPLHLRVLDDLRAQDLDDTDLVEKPVTDPIDGAHPALADLPEDLVLAFEEGSGLLQGAAALPSPSRL